MKKIMGIIGSSAGLLATPLWAASLTWDGNAATAPNPTDGSGTWDTGNSNWWNGAANVPWPNLTADTAVFGSGRTAGNVAVSGTVNVGAINFNSGTLGNYTLAGGTLNGLGTINLGQGGTTTSTINSNITRAGTLTILTGTNGAALNLGGALNVTGLNLGNSNATSPTFTVKLGGSSANVTGDVWIRQQNTLILNKPAGVNAISGNVTMGNGGYSAGTMFWLGSDQIVDTSVLNMSTDSNASATATATLNGFSEAIAGVNSSWRGTQNLIHNTTATPSTLTLSGSGTYNAGNISIRDGGPGVLNVVKTGAGIQNFNDGNIYYSGSTTINGGEIRLGAGNVGRGVWTINSGGILRGMQTDSINYIKTTVVNAGGKIIQSGGSYQQFYNGSYGGTVLILNGGSVEATVAGNSTYGNFLLRGDVVVGGTQQSVISADFRMGDNATRNFNVAPTGDPSGVDLEVTGKFSHFESNTWGYMTKSGDGVMRFNNPATSNNIGTITVNGGKVILANMINNGGNGGLTAAGKGTIDINPGSNQTYSNALHGSGVFNKEGSNTLTLTANSNNTGTFNINNGTVIAGGAASSGLGNVVVKAGTTLQSNGGDFFGYASNTSQITIQGGTVTTNTGAFRNTLSKLVFDGGGTLTAPAGNTGDANGQYSYYNNGGTAGEIRVINPGATTALISAPIFSFWNNLYGGTTFDVARGSAASDLTVSSSLRTQSGSTPIIKNGAGILTLSGDNTFSGATTVNGGTLALGHVNALKNSTLNTGFSGSQQVTFAVAGSNTYNVGGLMGSDDLAISGNTLSVGANNGRGTFTGTLSGSGGALTKVGTGILTLAGPTTYTGATTVTTGRLNFTSGLAGDLSVASGTTLGAGTSVAGNATLNGTTYNNTNGTLAITGSLTLSGTNTVNLQAPAPGTATYTLMTYGGSLTGTTGNLALANVASYRGSPVFSTATANQVNITGLDLKGLTWTGTGGATWDVKTTSNWTDGAAQQFAFGDAVTFTDAPASKSVALPAALISPGSITFNNSTGNDYSITGNAAGKGFTGATSITKNGTGTVTLEGFGHNYTGPVTINNGILQGNGNYELLGNTSGVTINNGGQLNINGLQLGAGTRAYSFTIAGAGANGLGAITNTSGTAPATNAGILNLTLSGNASVGGNGGRFDIGNANGFGTGMINGGGNTLTKVGSGIVVMRAPANNITYVVSAGTLKFEDSNAVSGTNAIAINGGTLQTYGTMTFANTLNFAAGTTLDNDGAGIATWTGPVNLGGTSSDLVNFSARSQAIVLSGVVAGNARLNVSSTNVLYLRGSSSNTYTGNTILASNGHLVLDKSGGAVAVPGDIYMSAPGSRGILSTLQDNQFGAGTVMRFTVTAGDTRFELKGTTQTLAGLDSTGFAGAYAAVQHSEFGTGDVATSNLSRLILNVGTGNSYTFGNTAATAVIRDQGGVVGITKAGLGTQTLLGNGIDYSGTTYVTGGKLIMLDNDDSYTAGFNISAGATVEVSRSTAADYEHRGAFTLNGGGSFIKSGTGLMDMNWDRGGTVAMTTGALIHVQGGTLRLGYGGISDWKDNKADMTLDTGTTFNLWDNNNNGVFVDALNGAGSISRTQNVTGYLTVGVDNGSGSFSGTISNASGTTHFYKTGSGTQTLTGASTYSGGTTIENGTLALGGGADRLPTGTTLTLGAGTTSGILKLNGSNQQVLSLFTNGTGTNNRVVNGNATSASLILGGNGTYEYSGFLGGPGANENNLSLVKTGSGTITLASANTFTGGVTIGNGGLSVASITSTGTAQPLGAGTAPITFTSAGTLTITGDGVHSSNRGLVLADNTNTLALGGTVTLTGGITGGGSNASLVKAGAGTFNLSGSGDWSGNFDINAGRVNVTSAGSINNAGAVTLTGATTLNINTATQVRASALNLSSGTVNFNSGTLRTNGITVAGGSTFTWGTGTTLTVKTVATGSSGTVDRTGDNGVGGAASGPVVKEGTILNVTASTFTTGTNSTLDLGGLYISGALRYDQLKVNGALNISANTTLNININPYFLRPSGPNDVASGDWGTLRLVMADSITGSFNAITGISSDAIGWTNLGTVTDMGIVPSTLPANSYRIEYVTSGVLGEGIQSGAAILFHYHVAGSVPEPASAGLLIAGAALLRTLVRRRQA